MCMKRKSIISGMAKISFRKIDFSGEVGKGGFLKSVSVTLLICFFLFYLFIFFEILTSSIWRLPG